MNTLGSRILELRTALNLSQEKFGDRLQVKPSHISNIEKDKKIPSPRLVKSIINEFNLNEEWLTSGQGPMFNFLNVAREKLHSTFDDINSRYADSALQLAAWRSDMLQKISSNIYAAYYEISDCPLVQENEIYLANEMITFILYSWANASEYDRIKLEGKFELIFPNFRQLIRAERARVIEENTRLGLAIPSRNISDISIPIQRVQIERALSIPVVGRAAAGLPIEMIEKRDESISADEIQSGDFAVIAVGDSMVEAGINDGDRVVIRPQETVENGEIALVAVDGGSTIKRFYRENNHFRLSPCNPIFEDQIYSKDTDLHVMGKLIKVIVKGNS